MALLELLRKRWREDWRKIPTREAALTGIPGTCCCWRRLPQQPGPSRSAPTQSPHLLHPLPKRGGMRAMTRSTPISSKTYLSCSIFQPLHEQDGGLEAKISPGAGSRSEPLLPQPSRAHGLCTVPPLPHTTGPSLLCTVWGSAQRLQPQGDPSPAQSCCLTRGRARSHAEMLSRQLGHAMRPDHCLGSRGVRVHRLLALPRELPHLNTMLGERRKSRVI